MSKNRDRVTHTYFCGLRQTTTYRNKTPPFGSPSRFTVVTVRMKRNSMGYILFTDVTVKSTTVIPLPGYVLCLGLVSVPVLRSQLL